ncbi:hypothetical protein [Marmoricola sp. URHB0036]|uniref:hypothetical protein n=1 Tax=Marmoricola sp. URHB0036 TaxID=1298863 RepID=UPI000484B10F|nr:hypothetical protein [Marmoricola sp. URHB0036]
MRVYERLWRGFWFSVMALGVGLAVLEWSAVGVLVTLVPLVALCCLVQYMLPDIIERSSGWGIGGHVLAQSLIGSVGFLTVWSFGRLTPALALLVVLTASVSSPAVVRRAIRSARQSPRDISVADANPPFVAPQPQDEGADSRLTQPEALGLLKGLDDWQLCRLWRESFWILREPASPVTVLRLVALREACLDELERRDAAALHAWLESGARASSGPEKYLAPPRRGDSA